MNNLFTFFRYLWYLRLKGTPAQHYIKMVSAKSTRVVEATCVVDTWVIGSEGGCKGYLGKIIHVGKLIKKPTIRYTVARYRGCNYANQLGNRYTDYLITARQANTIICLLELGKFFERLSNSGIAMGNITITIKIPIVYLGQDWFFSNHKFK